MPRHSLAISKERAALMRMLIELTRAVRDSIDPEISMDGDLCLVCEAVLLGHAEGRALTATEIANYLDMPRPSVHRRLDRLIELEVIVRSGDVYYLEPDRAKNVPHLKHFIEISQRAFAVLGPYLASKTDASKKI
jgi:hypothetical protein